MLPDNKLKRFLNILGLRKKETPKRPSEADVQLKMEYDNVVAKYTKSNISKCSHPMKEILIIGVGNAAKNVLMAIRKKIDFDGQIIPMGVGSYNREYFNNYYNIPLLGYDDLQNGTLSKGCLDGIETHLRKEVENHGIIEIIVIAGLGCKTGTKVSPCIIDIAKRLGVICNAAISLPFEFQGANAISQSLHALDLIESTLKNIVCFPLELIRIYKSQVNLLNVFQFADNWMSDTIINMLNGNSTEGKNKNVLDVLKEI